MTPSPSSKHPAEAMTLARVPQDVRERVQSLRLMIFDVDGVMTDGRLFYGEQGELIKQFHSLDGLGIRMLQESGIKVAFMTGRSSAQVALRAADLGISEVMQGVRDKAAALAQLAQRHQLQPAEIGFMGDDLIDLPAMQLVGFAASVPAAPSYVAQAAHWVATREGGHGAVREACDLILAAQGRLGAFVSARSLTTLRADLSPQ